MIWNEKIRNFIKVILPIIFISYACSISFFTHTHIENGVTIVHSHPYLTDENGNPDHKHSGAEIQLIQNLNTFFSTACVIFCISLSVYCSKQVSYILCKTQDILNCSFAYSFKLRPPPIF